MYGLRSLNFTLDRWTPEAQKSEDQVPKTTLPIIRPLNNASIILSRSIESHKLLPKVKSSKNIISIANSQKRNDFRLSVSVINIPKVLPMIKLEDPRKKCELIRRFSKKKLLKLNFIDISPFATNGQKSRKDIK